MSSPWIAALRSVALIVPDVEASTRFYIDTWHLTVAARSETSVYLRATGDAHHVLSLHPGDSVALRDVTFTARSADALQEIAHATVAAGGRIDTSPGAIDEPGGGVGVTLRDPMGRVFRVVHGDQRHSDAYVTDDSPIRLAHVVLNSHDVAATQHFFEQALGFRLSDRTRIMAFMNCNNDHHSVAIGDTDNDALNHIAFLMPDLESVMRGGGRMRDAGYVIEWGPGRHGPGNNAFNYFVGPDGVVIEYTAEVQQIDDSYQAGGPDDWKWPPGRIDQWGISQIPGTSLKDAQRAVQFQPEITK
ncbi:VOC family protein [Paraburkholderia sartisoli]|uniref:Catechol 2,3-dioxygenase n=1 Tax=Paraburkholderia sartisoli TaxID=83784 RepID=A0A1H4D3U5_9BURK|nr:VOC family protein [Paraburkholderia sartisoli]SEA67483.1 Catechol 2,3-dioxygenase [Paraburkholderia sartisoli]